MTAFTSRTSARHASLWDLAAIWVTLTATFAYLEVPVVNAPLFATALVLQAALGTTVITWLLNGVKPSLLLVLGPGLILGGALSFALFQLVGRGAVGIIAATLAGIASIGRLWRWFAREGDQEPRWWMLGQLVGMGMFAIAPEFTELLPVAAVFFILGFLGNPQKPRSSWLVLPACLAGAAVLAVTAFQRSRFWWVITDDYLLLEVIARHLTNEGPFASWGVDNFANYHWLSYGWSGLLNLLGGDPAPLVALTQVMPVVYSISMAASLVLIAKRLKAGVRSRTAILAAWAVVAVGRFEWTGTSTGGVYAVLAAAVALVLSLEMVEISLARAAALLLSFFLLVTLTKLPSVFALGLGVLVGLLEVLRQLTRSSRWGGFVHTIGLVATIPSIALAVWLFSILVDDRVRLTGNNYGLGQLAYFEWWFVVITIVLSQLWIWLVVGLANWQTIATRSSASWKSRWLVATSSAALSSALMLDVGLYGLANAYTYFSGPMYFLASLSILLIGVQISPRTVHSKLPWLTTAGLFVAGSIWAMAGINSSFWGVMGRVLGVEDATRVELLKFFTSDRRFGATLLFFVLLIALVFFVRASPGITTPLLTALALLSFTGLSRSSLEDFRDGVALEQIGPDLGSPSQQLIGAWINRNSALGDLIATNYLFDELEGSVSDYAFAVWSQREFLVLGPKLGYGTSPRRTAAFELSRSFAEEPTMENCSQLRSQGVRWFIVDMRLTRNRVWSFCAQEVFSAEDFVVFKIE
jgi:hypothetical protein